MEGCTDMFHIKDLSISHFFTFNFTLKIVLMNYLRSIHNMAQ